ncbi:DEKNAAC103804 [Brettanomyces naardenensis]|uniref:pyridoxal kinase n=1 Tax=Brettanomyces naardenensis TaxID=13370 RepID=A0A448YPG2_BRENA|nr:DEKNAAC103804 [Brettanomyces naardenensis]
MTRSRNPVIPKRAKKVLSIQSHVVHGYVGNKAATFPLQTLNWDVDVLNSVNFSNHTGYGSWKGHSCTGIEIEQLFEGLEGINMHYDAILTGYTHGASALKSVGSKCIAMKKNQPNIVWLLDPVMGDEGQLYVSKEVIPVYREILSHRLVDIITPNQFELELLLNIKITDLNSLRSAVKLLHLEFAVKYLVVSSLTLTAEALGLDSSHNGKMYSCISSMDSDKLLFFEIDRYDSYFTGVGDLFSALLLDRLYKSGDVVDSTNQVLSIMSRVLYVTREICVKDLGKEVNAKIGDFKTMKECELRIVECADLYAQQDCDYAPFEL